MGKPDEPTDVARVEDSFDAFLEDAIRASGSRRSASSARLNAGTKLSGGRFQIVRRLGEGGMGVVYEAFDSKRGGKVALKTLTHVDAQAIYRLKNEFRALSAVRHANLVRLHELFADEHTWFFTMELVQGARFDEWMARPGRLEDRTRADLRAVLAQLVRGVSAIHQAGKLHRDLKPGNVMLEHGGRVVVLDFGLVADPEAGGVGQTVVDQGLLGTPAYMAPEQAAGRASTAASDWYSLGVLLFEALTGRLPFEGRTGELLAAKQVRPAPSASELAPDAPPDLCALAAQLLEREPSARPLGGALHEQLGAGQEPNEVPILPPESAVALIGRERELGELRAAYRASVEGHKPVVLMLSGESGIGKSALMMSFLAELRSTTGALLLQGRCYERETVPFKAFDAIVDELSRHLRRLPSEDAALLTPREAWALTRLFPVLGRLRTFADAPPREGTDPHELRRRGFLAFGEVLGKLCDRAPLVLYIDDLQWTDSDSIALLFHLLRQADAPRFLCVGSLREGEHAPLAPIYEALPNDIRLDFRQLSVEPLSREQSALLVRSAIPERVLEEARGNPFLLGELARQAFEPGAQNLGSRSLSELLLRRCAALPEDAQRLLRAIALSGNSVPLDVATRAAESGPSALDALRDQQLVRRGLASGEVECYHDKIREALVAALDAEQTRSLHAALASAWASNEDSDPEQLALHHQGAGDFRRAAECAAQAAPRAAAAFAFERAARLYALALELGDFSPERTHELRLARADALAQAGHCVAAAKACVEAMATAPAGEVADLARRAGLFYLQSGWIDAALPLVNQGLAAYGSRLATSNFGALLRLFWQRLLLGVRGYRLRRGARNQRAVRHYEACAPVNDAIVTIDPLRSVALGSQMTRLALASGDPRLQARGLAAELINLMTLNRSREKVREYAVRTEAFCEQVGDPMALYLLNHTFGFFVLSEDPGLALPRLLRARELLLAHPNPSLSYRLPTVTWNLLHARCLQGAFAEVARQIPAWIDDAWAREHRSVLPFLASLSAVVRVAVEDLAALRHDLQRIRTTAVADTFTWQEVLLVQGELVWHLYAGEPALALEVTDQLAAKVRRSPARFAKTVREVVCYLGAWARLAYAQSLKPGTPERGRMLEHASTLLAQTALAPEYTGLWQPPLVAGIEALRGNRETAAASLRSRLRAATPVDKFPSYTVFVRRRLGEFVGGDEGARLVAEADRFLLAQGVVDPARFVAALAPGFSP